MTIVDLVTVFSGVLCFFEFWWSFVFLDLFQLSLWYSCKFSDKGDKCWLDFVSKSKVLKLCFIVILSISPGHKKRKKSHDGEKTPEDISEQPLVKT